ncbi:MAG: metallophosphoesterase [Bacteroidetes bacterium]|nr:metallophosphoesterase [Bacteroidota bacterium]
MKKKLLLLATITFLSKILLAQSVSLNGTSQYVNLGNDPSNHLSNFTLEAWIKIEGTGITTSTGSGGVTIVPILAKGRAEAELPAVDVNYFLGYDPATNKLTADFEDNATSANHPVTGNATLGTCWTHVAATYDVTLHTWKLYVNGILDKTLDLGANFTPQSLSDVSASVGTALTSTGVASGFFLGRIDEVRIWNVVRNDAEILANYNIELTSASGLISRWGFNEGTGSLSSNSVGGGSSANLISSPSWGAGYNQNMLNGSCLDFNGTSSYVTFGASPTLNASAFTLEAWINIEGAGVTTTTSGAGGGGLEGVNAVVPIVSKGRGEGETPSNINMNYFLGLVGNKLAADFEEGTGPNHAVIGNASIPSNTWTHVAATYEPVASIWKLYINGILDKTLDIGTNIFPANTSIQHAAVGSALTSAGVAAGFFNGKIDEVRIWNVERSGSQISSNYTVELTNGTGLLGRWGFDDAAAAGFCNGATATNSISGGVNGTIIGSPTWVLGSSTSFAPNQPSGPSPAANSNSGTTSPTLCTTVSDPNGGNLEVRFYGRSLTSTADKFTIIGLPDTQFYTEEPQGLNSGGGGHNGIFKAQTQWIADHRLDSNIAFVVQLGDCAQNGDANLIEWMRADTSMKNIEFPNVPIVDGIPYGICVGNHDQGPIGNPDGTTNYYNQYFGVSRFSGRGYYGGHYNSNNDNHFELFNAGGIDFIHISIEYYANTTTASLQPVLDWADALLKTYSNRKAILSSHNILGSGNPASFQGPGQKIYDDLKDNPNLILMLAGHVPGEGRRTDVFNGNTVHTLMSDYQSGYTNGGNGYLRIMQFLPDQNQLRVKSYSPYSNTSFTGSSSDFSLPVNLTQAFTLLGTNTNVSSGSVSCMQWPLLQSGQSYEWYVEISDGLNTTVGPIWSFTATGGSAPVITTEPIGQSVCPETIISFVSAAGGDPALAVQWQISTDNGASWLDSAGAVNPNLSFTAHGSDDGKLYRAIWSNAFGTDTSIAAQLSIAEFTTSTSVLSACGSILWNGSTYSSSGIYTSTGLMNAAGCDSIAILQLTISSPTSSVTSVTECESYSWNGTTYNSSGIYTATGFINSAGCDSTATLILTINNTSSSSNSVTACDHYTWNGNTYTATGTYIVNGFTNSAGCDSSAVLVLTINNNGSSLTTLTACDSVTWNGVTYFTSGTYSSIGLTTIAGCDSTALLNLTINHCGPYSIALNSATQQYASLGNDISLHLTNFTLEAWIKIEGTGVTTSTGSGGVTVIPILAKGRAEAELANVDVNYFLGYDPATNKLTADFEDNATSANHPVTGNVTLGTCWTHVAATYDVSLHTWKLYVNGILDKTLDLGASFTPQSLSNVNASIGSALTSTGTAAGFFNGKIDEVRIWNVVRSDSQILASYSAEMNSGTGLVSRWGFNEGSGTQASNAIPTRPPAVLVNGATWATGFNQNTLFGSNLDFNGTSNYVSFGAAPSLNASAFTLEAWINIEGTGVTTTTSGAGGGGLEGTNAVVPIVTKGRGEAETPANINMNYFLGLVGNKLAADFEEGIGPNHAVIGNAIIPSNTWTHVAATYEPVTAVWKLYINGILDKTLDIGTNIFPANTSIQHACVGSAMTSTGVAAGFFNGKIDEVRIWNVDRSPTQILSNYSLELSNGTGLLGRWGFNEGCGLTAGNSISGGATGTLSSSTGPIWGTTNFLLLPSVSLDPLAQTKCEGQTATFISSATGSPTPAVQWQLSTDNGSSWSNISGATSASLSFVVSASDNGKRYRAIWSNVSGQDTTSPAILTVNTSTSSTTTLTACGSYVWNGFTYTNSGIYSISGFTNAAGCDSTAQLNLTISNLNISESHSAISCFGGSSSVTISAQGGTAPYNGTGVFSQTAGTTTYTVTDATGCTASIVVTLLQPSALSIYYSVDSVTSIGGSDGGINVIVSGGTPVYEYVWSNSSTSQNLTDVPVGTYSLTLTDANGCMTTETIPVGATANASMTVHLHLFIQGYYMGNQEMRAPLFSSGLSSDPTACDSITIEFRNSSPVHGIEFSSRTLLHTDGNCSVNFPGSFSGGQYFIVIRHRNSLETWSAAAQLLQHNDTVEFADVITKAYGNNLATLGDGFFGLWSGDVSDGISPGLQDGMIETSDYIHIENASQMFLAGYVTEDLTGDVLVESADYSLAENNMQILLIVARP